MGYCMHLRDSHFKLKPGKEAAALQAIKCMVNRVQEKGIGFSSNGGGVKISHYAWVRTSELQQAQSFKEAMAAWRWRVEYDKSGQIKDIFFDGEKLGDDAQLFDAIAPYVQEKCFLEMVGEDGAIWRWSFDGKIMFEQDAHITWI